MSLYFSPTQNTNVKLVVTKNGEICPYIIADDQIARRCRALKMIEAELVQAVAFVDLINEQQTPPMSLALWHAAIMSYARCFSSAWGRGTQLQVEHVRMFNATAETLHNEIMDLRNEYVVHAGNHGQEITIVVVSLAPKSQPKAIESIGYGQITTMGPNSSERLAFAQLAHGLLAIAKDLLTKSEERLLETHKKMDIEKLYRESIQ